MRSCRPMILLTTPRWRSSSPTGWATCCTPTPSPSPAVRLPGDPRHLTGRSLLSLGFQEEDHEQGQRAGQAGPQRARRGRARSRSSAATARAVSSAPRRCRCATRPAPSTGIVIIAREALQRHSRRERDRIGLLERIGERLAGSLELDATLRHVAEMLVPQFADHCFIDLLQGDKLVRRVAAARRRLEPPPGTWAPVGEQISYPAGPLLPAGDGRDGDRHRRPTSARASSRRPRAQRRRPAATRSA